MFCVPHKPIYPQSPCAPTPPVSSPLSLLFIALLDDSPGSFAAGVDNQNLSHNLYNLTVVDSPDFELHLRAPAAEHSLPASPKRSTLASSRCETNKSAFPKPALAQLGN